MTAKPLQTAAPSVVRPYLPALLLLFVGSGCAALIYEIVWFQMLELIIGSSAVSIGVLLATYMGGMCLGALGLSRYISARQHPLRVYAMIEFGIGALGLIVLFSLPYLGGLYIAVGGPGTMGLVFRAIVCGICLLPPTILMGATLPAISRWIETTPRGVSWLGLLYASNTGGAVVGCILAGFYLLRVHDMTIATLVAVAVNLSVGFVAWLLSRSLPHDATSAEAASARKPLPAGAWPILITTALSGLTALGAEVVWTRILSLMLGATTYTFSLILAAFLLGIGLGSGAGSYLARALNPRTALGWCQLLLVACMAWAAYSLTQALPYWPVNPTLSSSPMFTFQLDLVRCLWVVLPAAILWGASFPLGLAALASGEKDHGRLVGTIYAANTIGAIVGALGVSLVTIAWIGTQQTQRVLMALAAISALVLLLPTLNVETGKLVVKGKGIMFALVVLLTSAWLAKTVHPIPPLMIGYGRFTAYRLFNHGEFIYEGEGRNATLAVSRLSNGVLNYHNAGKVQASSEPQDMRLERMLGHLTTLIPAHPRRVLVIGCGAGVTAGAVSIDPAVESMTIAELEPLVPQVVSKYFSEENFSVVTNPKVKIEIDDGRHFLLTTKEKFDAITADPFDPWTKGAATLSTKEFYQLVRAHLNPGGIITVWVPLYENNVDAVKSELATFFSVFPNGQVWGNTQDTKGYDLVLAGRLDDAPINLDELSARLATPGYAEVVQSLQSIGFSSLDDLFATFAVRGADLQPWLADAQINRDRNLRLEFLAGLGLNEYQEDAIYQQMLAYRRFPASLFTGSPDRLASLAQAIGGRPQ